MIRSFIVCLALLLTGACQAAEPPLSIAAQGSFFVGGHDVHSTHLATVPNFGTDGTITIDQVYVHYQIPATAKPGPPITFIHGCCLTGKTWETTPDGRMGWDEYFLRKGFPVYLIDQAERGRSAASPVAINSVKTGDASPDSLPMLFSAGHEAAWVIFRFGPEYPRTFPGLLFPIEAQAEMWKQMVPDWAPSLPTPNPTVAGLTELGQRLKGTVLVSHSQSGIYPFQAAQASREGIAAIIAIEPGACPAPDSDMGPYAGLPVLLVWGDHVEESPRWAPRLKSCRAFVEAANRAGGRVELLVLPEIGIKGNSHMLMQDRNSQQVADILIDWIGRRVHVAAAETGRDSDLVGHSLDRN